MGVNDAMNYVLFNNPVATNVWSFLSSNKSKTAAIAQQAATHSAKVVVVSEPLPPLWKILGPHRHILKLAGLSGAVAVMLGAYGAHHKFNSFVEKERDPKAIFEMTNRYHIIHSLALLAAPLARKPVLTAILFSAGMALFCGTCYYISFTNDRRVAKLTPVGGFLLIFGWLSFML
ncbi:transmembrane protein 256-like [Topomyia yanbarensis]|uniref:transmembrane protein 256-like n=1 Tax=Topomyia yanbarensis TaxID=2498891 RepID=UPI00273BF2BB|nr:transmembrane protein 256-like [Topomyia yanbarensis]XP_058825446.1 transmembrane protein 256-like [Topomyia yanbarensis]